MFCTMAWKGALGPARKIRPRPRASSSPSLELLLASSWLLLGSSWAPLGSSWPPLGLLLAPLGLLLASSWLLLGFPGTLRDSFFYERFCGSRPGTCIFGLGAPKNLLLGCSWVPLCLLLAPLGLLLASSWLLLGSSWTLLDSSWAPLGLLSKVPKLRQHAC